MSGLLWENWFPTHNRVTSMKFPHLTTHFRFPVVQYITIPKTLAVSYGRNCTAIKYYVQKTAFCYVNDSVRACFLTFITSSNTLLLLAKILELWLFSRRINALTIDGVTQDPLRKWPSRFSCSDVYTAPYNSGILFCMFDLWISENFTNLI